MTYQSEVIYSNATYRLQLNGDFVIPEVAFLVDVNTTEEFNTTETREVNSTDENGTNVTTVEEYNVTQTRNVTVSETRYYRSPFS